MNTQNLVLTSKIPPSVNHYLGHRVTYVRRGGKQFPTVMIYEKPESKRYKSDFKKHIIEEVKKQGWTLPVSKEQHFYIDCIFYFDRIDDDPNNYFKLPLDAITETQLIWIDDNVTCERVNRIYYDKENPRIEMHIYPVDYIGIFDDADQMSEFENKCSTCSRYGRNCSILKKAKEGRIQSEIADMNCKKYKLKK